ncbi:MAG: hypothetical protein E6J09_02515 [Chloroflexi bacterium]|nr:MAG: hypothetical protein E6J09_02515 [Chloroflexota bacterium]
MASGQAEQRESYAVVRLDSFRGFTPRPENVTVKKVVSSLADAELEVRYLNGLAATGTVYFVQRTTVALESRAAQPVSAPPVSAPPVSAPPIAASAPKPAPDARSRRARAEKKKSKKNKKKSTKGRRK